MSARTRLGYASGSLVTGAFNTLPGLLLLPYLTDTLGVGAALAGAVVLVPKVWDVLLTPLAGRIGDRSHGRWGPRRGHILGGGLGVAAAFALMFAGAAKGPAGALWAAAGFLLTATAFAFFQAAYAALPAEITASPQERVRLVGGRVAGIAVAALVAGSAAPAVVEAGGGGLSGHRWAGLFGALVIAAGTLGVFLGTSRAGATASTGSAGAPRDGGTRHPAGPRAWFAVLRGDPQYAALLRGAAALVVGTGVLLAGCPYYAEHVLERPGMTGVLVAAFVLPNLFTTGLWSRVGARYGHRRVLGLSCALFGGGSLLLFAAPVLPLFWAPVALLVVGAGHAGQLLFLYAMLAECSARDAVRTGRSRAGAMSGLFSAGEALGLAVGPFLMGLVLQLSGYVSSDTGHATGQSSGAAWGVLAGMALLPALATAAGLVLLRGFRPASPAPVDPAPVDPAPGAVAAAAAARAELTPAGGRPPVRG
ncbi:MFS transporter [Streptomyces sp. NBC_00091]|uniref:MFS transporter n=1 Tax=Streptomyces sp. NBC_00091 TaxID=2975648 RepID=UPI0022544615|nr:MFS transporter [Streptomyces sp. NBC_00091]MCX5381045.1 MFS transporter [Streptomyces sp. NBC_00091]